jgi:hypothetical protein
LKWILGTLILVSVLGAGVMIWTCYASFQMIQSIPLDKAYLSIMRPVIFILTLVSWTLPIFYFGGKYYLSVTAAIQKNLQWWLIGFLLLWTLVIIWLSYQSLSIIESEIRLGEDGEPFFLNAGISLWPTELIRLFAGILSYLFIVDAIIAVLQNNQNLKEDFNLSIPHPNPKDVAELWQDHCSAKNLYWCGGSIAVLSIVFLCFGFSIIDSPFVPYREVISHKANTLMLNCFSVPLFVILLMTVFVITLHGVIMIKQLNALRTSSSLEKLDLPIFSGLHSVWPQKALSSYSLLFDSLMWKELRKALEKNDKYHLDAWLDILFIAAYTKVVGRLVYYPFVIFALMIFARSKIFDNWNMPIGLAIVLVIAAALTLFSAFYLRIVAEQVREDVLTHIASMKINLSGQIDADEDARSAMEKQIDLIITKIQGIHEGAFQPLTHAPAFQALFIPFGGLGSVMFLENWLLNGI